MAKILQTQKIFICLPSATLEPNCSKRNSCCCLMKSQQDRARNCWTSSQDPESHQKRLRAKVDGKDPCWNIEMKNTRWSVFFSHQRDQSLKQSERLRIYTLEGSFQFSISTLEDAMFYSSREAPSCEAQSADLIGMYARTPTSSASRWIYARVPRKLTGKLKYEESDDRKHEWLCVERRCWVGELELNLPDRAALCPPAQR